MIAALAATALLLGTPQDGAGDGIAELPSIAAGEAKEVFDQTLEDALGRFRAAFDPLQARWSELDGEHDAGLAAARSSLLEGLREAAELGRRRGDVDEALQLERALQQIETGDAIPVPPEAGRPPRGCVKRGERRYLRSEGTRGWHDALAECEQLGGTLACGETAEEYAFLVELAGGEPVWIGGTDARAEGEWVWLSGAPLDIDWGPAQPDDYMAFEHAATIRTDGSLDDRLATDPLRYLYEWGQGQAPAWEFRSHKARKAKETYDRVATAAREKRDAGRAKLERSATKPTDAARAGIDRAERDLVRALERACEEEVRAGRADVALELREAAEAVERGALRPALPSLGSRPALPADAIAFRGRHVKVFDGALPFHAAQERSAAMGGRLAVLTDAELRELLQGEVGQGWYWVGAHDPKRQRDFVWIDGTKLSAGWLEGEPNNWREIEFAVVLTAGGLNDALAEERFGWICEWAY